MAALAAAAVNRLKTGFRPATLSAYTRMLKDFLAFLHLADIPLNQVTTIIVLSFMEFLAQNGLSHSNIANHMAGIRALLIMYGLDTSPFKDERITLFLKSVKINAPLNPMISNLVSLDLLRQIVDSCDQLKDPLVFKALYLFMFYSFLRLSNVLPHSTKMFDVTRHLTRGDLIFSQSVCTVIVKWSKTLQDRRETTTIAIPVLPDSPVCPVSALKAMFSAYPAHKNDPLFVLCHTGVPVPLADSQARKHLKKISQLLNIQPYLTFHVFRRSGTTCAFQAGVPLQDLMAHGTWSSNAVWRYIKSVPSASSPVSRAFQASLLP